METLFEDCTYTCWGPCSLGPRIIDTVVTTPLLPMWARAQFARALRRPLSHAVLTEDDKSWTHLTDHLASSSGVTYTPHNPLTLGSDAGL
ncbi:hypothetical protein TNCV_2355071 [Trichonephila clavipes]|nr:hypothetical protein TNCV_2355071 [Trichonephila clavipes]